jgi:hypothetical protein
VGISSETSEHLSFSLIAPGPIDWETRKSLSPKEEAKMNTAKAPFVCQASPSEYDSLNGGDRDFGSSGLGLLDPGTFSGGEVSRIAIAGGNNGKLYVLNADNLEGFALGPSLKSFHSFWLNMLNFVQRPVVQMLVSTEILD